MPNKQSIVFIAGVIGLLTVCGFSLAGSDYTIYPGSIFKGTSSGYHEDVFYSGFGKAYARISSGLMAPITRQHTTCDSVDAWIYVHEQADKGHIHCWLYSRNEDQTDWEFDDDLTSTSGVGDDTLHMAIDAWADYLEFGVYCSFHNPWKDYMRINTMKIKESF